MVPSVTSLATLLDEVLAPLIVADSGELYILEATREQLHLHLRGRFSGCPGNTLVIQRLIEPAVAAVFPDCAVRVSSGELVPPGARRWTADAATCL